VGDPFELERARERREELLREAEDRGCFAEGPAGRRGN